MPRSQRLATASIAMVLLLSACGGTSSELPEATSADSVVVAPENEAASAEGEPQAEAPALGQPAGTLALSNGETFELDVRSCETQSTDPDSFFTDDFFDLSGETTDGRYYFSANKVTTVDGETLDSLQFELRGERDENGVNPKIDYLNHRRPGVEGTPQTGEIPGVFTVDGSRVTGEVILVKGFSTNAAFGETVTATFEFICG